MNKKENWLNQHQQLIHERRSVRHFVGRPLSTELIDTILEAGRWAPSGLNNQPWRFAVIQEPQLKLKIAELTKYHKIIETAPAIICVFLDNNALYHREKDIQSIGAALQNMLLMAHSLGLGAVWLGEILKNGAKLGNILELPTRYELMAVVAVGYPAPTPQSLPASRKPLADLVLLRR
ncbi:MAG: nitroreductase family protein [Deltaproteobacteria bacterium]|nr:nitroreductase family protein [Deltaproteobacteria bacterium]